MYSLLFGGCSCSYTFSQASSHSCLPLYESGVHHTVIGPSCPRTHTDETSMYSAGKFVSQTMGNITPQNVWSS